MKNENIGSNFDDWLREEGLFEQVTAVAVERGLARQAAREMMTVAARIPSAARAVPRMRGLRRD